MTMTRLARTFAILTTLAGAAAALAAGACAPARQYGPAGYRADLSGSWLLDPSLSNDSSAFALAFADSADPRLRSGRGRRFGRNPSTGLAGVDTVYRMDPARTARRALAAVREPPARLTIAATDSLVTFRFGAGQDVALGTGWTQVAGSWGDDRVWRLRARWREGRLEVERDQPQQDGVQLHEYYSRSPGGDRLVVWTTITVQDDELSVRRVYRLAPGAAAAGS